ncbi:hypothetical protein AVEN_5247-1, partial [Araneus ventricosus]
MSFTERIGKKLYLFPFSSLLEISAGNVVIPDQDDLSGAAKALLRVQQTYSLDTESLSEGRILGAANGLPLS